ncbi:MAG: hypothetical protein ACI8WB_000948 [Phenylobacterium sp.]|jgi:hypothetical protein
MRGIYLNTDSQALATSLRFFADNNLVVQEQYQGQQLTLVYNKSDWSTPPVLPLGEDQGGGKVFCSGWFIYNQKRNDLAGLMADYHEQGEDVFNQISLGVFVLVIITAEQVKVICDAFGVSTHYVRVDANTNTHNQGLIEVAPSVKAFSQLPAINPLLAQTIEAQGHLFGNFTAYDGITRLDPGASVAIKDAKVSHHKYFAANFNSPDKERLDDIPQVIEKLVDCWPEQLRTLPISGGLDSRLTLSGQRYQYGYTYGPENSGDRPIARLFADCFNHYEEFEFTTPPLMAQEKPMSDDFYFGVSTWLPRLMTIYHYSFERCNGSYVLFDGYLGDVLQRGNYIKFGGAKGSILKMFPWLYKLAFSARFILRNRYKAICDEAFELLMTDFHQRTDELAADTYQKVIYYEFIYGRGGRFAINGSNTTAGQMYAPVPFFLATPIFDMLISQNFADTVQYKQVGKIWRKVPKRFREVVADSGISPMTPYWLAPFKNMFTRFLLHYVPGFGNYGQGTAKKPESKG